MILNRARLALLAVLLASFMTPVRPQESKPFEPYVGLPGKDVMVGVIDVASEQVETPAEVADTIGRRPPIMAMGTGPLSGLVHMFLLGSTEALEGFLELSGPRIVNPGLHHTRPKSERLPPLPSHMPTHAQYT